MPNQTLQLNFQNELAKLNPAQRQAVETTEGPVLVVAGPGTGKTQILAARIGYILSKAELQAGPHNILCLTYTDAGVTAMRERLVKFIGSDAHKVHIHTFHSFCNMVIQDNPTYFGMSVLDPVSELEQVEILKEIIDGLETDHILKKQGMPYYEVDRLKKLFPIMKKENWDEAYIKAQVQAYITDLPNREGFTYKRAYQGNKAGDPNQNKINAEVEKLQPLLAAAALYETYQQKMQARGRYDFDDMINWVLKAFQGNENLLRQYQEQFLYFLVDEYQDTNGSQNELLKLMFQYWDEPNVFAVGDDDQSIYRFQGANLKNILDFAEVCGEATQTVVLTDNYRSSQNILDTARQLIDHNTERLTKKLPNLSKVLTARNENCATLEHKPELREYANTLQESIGLAQEIEKLAHDGVDLSKVAVLYHNHKEAEDILRYLRAKDIPVNQKKRVDILQEPLIKKLVTMLRYIDAETKTPGSGEELLFQMLHFDFVQLPANTIAKLAAEKAMRNYKDKAVSWRELLLHADKHEWNHLFEIEEAIAQRMIRFGELLERWITAVHNTTLPGLVEQVMTDSGMVVHVLKQPGNSWNIELLQTFFSFVKDECQRRADICLPDLIKALDTMLENSIAIPVNKVVSGHKGVNLVTAHSSKGLEFEYVYLMNCCTDTWNKKRNSNKQYTMPDTLVQSNTGDELEEGRRLFFVALTRAKKHLIVSYPAADNAGKEKTPSCYVSELKASNLVDFKKMTLSEGDLVEYNLAIHNNEREKPEIELLDKDVLDLLLQNYSLSATHLNSYLRCPISFYYENLLRVPSAKNETACFGTAVHYALQRQFERIREGAQPDKTVLVNDFERSMKRQRAYFTPEAYTRRLDFGKSCLEQYFDHYNSTWSANALPEKNLRNIMFGEVPLNGKLDVLVPNSSAYDVVDYKTGKPENRKNKLKAPTDFDNPDAKFEARFGGDYWRQAVFYKVLLDHEKPKTFQLNSIFFDFVQPDKDGGFVKEKVVITPEEEELVKGLITQTYTSILNHEFSEGCGEPECKWCNFTKEHQQVGENDTELLVGA